MNTSRTGTLIAGAGGVLLIVSLFLPWADADGVSATGWELLTVGDVFFLTAGSAAIVAALTGGRIGFFRPDMSLNALTDILGVVSTILLVWLIAFDFPEGAGREPGVFLALIAANLQAWGAVDYTVLRGAPMFPRLPAGERDEHREADAVRVPR